MMHLGEDSTIGDSVTMLRPGGTYYLVGYGGTVTLPTVPLVLGEVTIAANLIGTYPDLAGLSRSPRRQARQWWDDTCVSGEVSVLGLNIAYEMAGSGPPVALAHGFVGDARSTWGSQIDALADEFTVVAWDAPGAGRSQDPPEGFGMDDYADCLAALLRTLRIERAHLVGLSFGGALVLATFGRHRDLVSSLALVSGYAGWRGSLGAQDAEQRLARSLQASGLAPGEFAAAMVPSMFSPSARGELVAGFIDSVRAVRPGGFRAMARASFDDQSHVLRAVDVPTLLLYADHDLRAPVAIGEAIHAEVRGSELVVLTGPGHVSPVEAPGDVTRELRRFLHSAERLSRDLG